MKPLGLLLILILINCQKSMAQSQWQTLNLPVANRYDDIFFENDSIGYTINSTGELYKTTNGGKNWNLLHAFNEYLRCIEFSDENHGFIGSLDSSFFMTTNGGNNWYDLAPQFSEKISGVCGISVVNETIFACGKWSGPAFILKSTNNGSTWSYLNLDSLAEGLVEIHFFDEQIGFAAGRGKSPEKKAIILKTFDGGNSWKKVFEGNFNQEFVWKLETPTNQMVYASIQASPAAQKTRLLKSNDGGNNFFELAVSDTFYQTQLVGFFNENHGFVGGLNQLFETFDGGNSWKKLNMGASHNRFFKLNSGVGFITGNQVYRFGPPFLSVNEFEQPQAIHEIKFLLNYLIEVKLKTKTHVELQLVDLTGKTNIKLFDEFLFPGNFQIELPKNLKSGIYIVVLHTNEGVQTLKINFRQD